ncbi:MAG: rhomboid family intramembrane serine protease [Syntrophomonadaceae bacterium]|nr:rhomboid family intramembrane serine protease [Syntrophomonadaceae bacterium]
MIPLRDSTRSQSFPVVTVFLIFMNVYIYIHQVSLGTAGMENIFFSYGLVPVALLNGENYASLFSYMFLHGSLMHLIGNMWILWLFGDNVEDKMGKGQFLLFYLICGVLAALSHFVVNPYSYIPVVGASGAVAGVMGAYFLMFKRARILTLVPPFFLINIPAWIYLGFWAISQLWCGAQDIFATGTCGQIAFWAHIGGFVVGMLLYRTFLKKEPIYR